MDYIVSISNSINRILKTPLGSRVMKPEFGSRLYELRDRECDTEFKLLAQKYIYEAIKKNEPRVNVESVDFKVDAVKGIVTFIIHLTNNETVEVKND